MGGIIEKFMNSLFKRKEVRLMMLGLDAAGKTSILYRLKFEQFIQTIPTIGFNIETVKYKNLDLVIWDICASPKIIPLWNQYIPNSQGLIFVIDSSDTVRIGRAKQELHNLITNEHLKNSAILIFANKSDIAEMKIEEITQLLELKKIQQKWHIQSSCALTGAGILEGMQWMAKEIDKI